MAELELTPLLSGLPVSADTPCLVFLAGFPDDHGSWQEIAPRFADTHTLIVLCLPDYDRRALRKRWGYSFDEIVSMVDRQIEEHGARAQSITLVAHDWGAFVAWKYVGKFPARLDKLIVLDVGLMEPNKAPLKDLAVILLYQSWLTMCFILSQMGLGLLGDVCMMLYPWSLIGPCPNETVLPKRLSGRPGSFMCYPYFRFWFGEILAPGKVVMIPKLPILFVYGKNKRAAFHSQTFLDKLESREDCDWKALDCGHFIQVQQPDELEEAMRVFLRVVKPSPAS